MTALPATPMRDVDAILRAAFERLLVGSSAPDDLPLLRRAVLAGRAVWTQEAGSVSIGGDNSAQINTGTIINANGGVVVTVADVDLPKLKALWQSLTQPQPGLAPPLPPLFLGRDEAMRELKARLGVGGATPGPLQVLTAVRGWPGVGKTSTAAALAHDDEVNRAFPDGVLWTSLGAQPNLASELDKWGRALGIPDLLQAPSLDEAAARLRARLHDKQMLLIIDDVWEAEHVRHLTVGGARCATLVTTRENALAQRIAPGPGNVYRLKELTDADALALLTRLAPTVVAANLEACKMLVQVLEGLPLAIQVAGRMLHTEAAYGFGVDALLTELQDGVKLLRESAPSDRIGVEGEANASIAVLLKKSTDRLDTDTRECFAFLGPFAPKPATFDLDALTFVWQPRDPKPVVRTLVDRGLLEPVQSIGRFWLHSLLVAHANSLLDEA